MFYKHVLLDMCTKFNSHTHYYHRYGSYRQTHRHLKSNEVPGAICMLNVDYLGLFLLVYAQFNTGLLNPNSFDVNERSDF
jgi:hypothetical protein